MRAGAFLIALVLIAGPALGDDVSIPAPPDTLHGTRLKAGLGTPAVLMIAGSGPTDRDGNNVLGVRGASYRLLAEGLKTKGVSTLRYDKRGIGESKSAYRATFQTLVDDADLWATELHGTERVDCVWLLGHSEGALIALIVASKRHDICGLVLVSGPGRSMGDLMAAQFQANPANPPELVNAALHIIAALKAGHTVKDVPPLLQTIFSPGNQTGLMSEINVDPAALISKTKIPVLIMQGETDIQISVQDAKLLAAAQPSAKLVLLPGMNHVLKIAPADRTANLATYANSDLPLAPGVVDSIATFVHEHSR